MVGNDSEGFLGAASTLTICPSRFVTVKVTSVTSVLGAGLRTIVTASGAWPCAQPAGKGGRGLDTELTDELLNGPAPVPEHVTRLIR